MRDAAGQTSDGIHFLRLEELRERGFALACPLVDALLQLIVEALQGRRTLGHPLLELGIETLELPGLAI